MLLSASRSPHGAQCFPLPDTADVWVWNLDLLPASIAPYESLLDGGERDRARRFHAEEHRRRFIAAHAITRCILADYLAVHPALLAFRYGSFGKPALQVPAGGASLHFNLSHTSNYAALAVSCREVGVDVEHIRPIERAIMQNLSHSERAQLDALAQSDWLLAFYSCWTSKEAILKAEGVGLHADLTSFDVSVDASRPPALLAMREACGFRRAWDLLRFDPTPDHIGTVAIERCGGTPGVRRLEYPADLPQGSWAP